MKVVIQRVNKASVTIEGVCEGSINKGLVILVGIGADMDVELVNDGPFTIVLDEY